MKYRTKLGDALTANLSKDQLIELTIIAGITGREQALPQAVYNDLVQFLEEEHGLDALDIRWVVKVDVNYYDVEKAAVEELPGGSWLEVEAAEIRAEYEYEA